MTSLAIGGVLLQNYFALAHPYVIAPMKFAGLVVLTADYLLGRKAENRSFCFI